MSSARANSDAYSINVQTGNFLNPQFAGPDPSNTFNFGGRPDLIKAIDYPRTMAAWYDRTAFVRRGGDVDVYTGDLVRGER